LSHKGYQFAHAVIGSEWGLTMINLTRNNHVTTDDTNKGTSATEMSEIKTNEAE
jgi:hypothetical protein